MHDIQIGLIDFAIIICYLLFIVGLGLSVGWGSWKKANGGEYFLANRSLAWPIVGLALFSTNISTIEIVSLAQEGYRSGLLYGNLELMAAFALITLAIVFVPFYIKSSVTTLPEFLEKRFDSRCRRFHVFLSLVSAIFIHIGFAIFAGAKVFEGLLEIDVQMGIVLILGLTGLYTIVGGFKAVVLTEAIQTVILIAGSVIMTLIGFYKVGGWGALTNSVDPEMLTMLRSAERAPDMSWYSILLGYPIIGIWYFCTDQTIVQRVLASKDERHARLGAIFTGFIKVFSVFIFIMPGLICQALINQGEFDNTLSDSAETYSFLIANLLPVGLKGIVVAAMLSALMSTVA